MFKGKVEYAAVISRGNFVFAELILKTDDPRIVKLTMAGTNDGKIKGIAELEGLETREEARFLDGVLERKLDNLAYKYDLSIQRVEVSGGDWVRYPEEDPSVVFAPAATNVVRFSGVACVTIVRNPEAIRADLERDCPFAAEIGLYRNAMACMEPVARYMFLYSTLLTLFDDSQGAVDDYFRENAPPEELQEAEAPARRPKSSKKPPKPKSVPKPETIYTRLRNEVGHVRGAHAGDVRKQMERLHPRLAEHVKKAIQDRIGEMNDAADAGGEG